MRPWSMGERIHIERRARRRARQRMIPATCAVPGAALRRDRARAPSRRVPVTRLAVARTAAMRVTATRLTGHAGGGGGHLRTPRRLRTILALRERLPPAAVSASGARMRRAPEKAPCRGVPGAGAAGRATDGSRSATSVAGRAAGPATLRRSPWPAAARPRSPRAAPSWSPVRCSGRRSGLRRRKIDEAASRPTGVGRGGDGGRLSGSGQGPVWVMPCGYCSRRRQVSARARAHRRGWRHCRQRQ